MTGFDARGVVRFVGRERVRAHGMVVVLDHLGQVEASNGSGDRRMLGRITVGVFPVLLAVPTVELLEEVVVRSLPSDGPLIFAWYFSQPSDALHLPLAACLIAFSLTLATTRSMRFSSRIAGIGSAFGIVVIGVAALRLRRWSPPSLGSGVETILWNWLAGVVIGAATAWYLSTRPIRRERFLRPRGSSAVV